MNQRFWVWVAPADDIPPREGRVVSLAGREIAIFNLGGRFLATDNRCPHRGGPLADGIVSGAAIVCPLHGWRIGLACGRVERPAGTEACIETYPVRVDRGIVVIGLPAPAADGRPRTASAGGATISGSRLP
jgi:nitrite reductase (NADH) small subunit